MIGWTFSNSRTNPGSMEISNAYPKREAGRTPWFGYILAMDKLNHDGPVYIAQLVAHDVVDMKTYSDWSKTESVASGHWVVEKCAEATDVMGEFYRMTALSVSHKWPMPQEVEEWLWKPDQESKDRILGMCELTAEEERQFDGNREYDDGMRALMAKGCARRVVSLGIDKLVFPVFHAAEASGDVSGHLKSMMDLFNEMCNELISPPKIIEMPGVYE